MNGEFKFFKSIMAFYHFNLLSILLLSAVSHSELVYERTSGERTHYVAEQPLLTFARAPRAPAAAFDVDVTVLLASDLSAEVAALLAEELVASASAALRSVRIRFHVERVSARGRIGRVGDAIARLPETVRAATAALDALLNAVDATSSDARFRPLSDGVTLVVFESQRPRGFRVHFASSAAELDAALALSTVADEVRWEREVQQRRFRASEAEHHNVHHAWHEHADAVAIHRAASDAAPVRVALRHADAAETWAAQRLDQQPSPPPTPTVLSVLGLNRPCTPALPATSAQRAQLRDGQPPSRWCVHATAERSALLVELMLREAALVSLSTTATTAAAATAVAAAPRVDRWAGRKRLIWLDLSASSASVSPLWTRVDFDRAAAANSSSTFDVDVDSSTRSTMHRDVGALISEAVQHAVSLELEPVAAPPHAVEGTRLAKMEEEKASRVFFAERIVVELWIVRGQHSYEPLAPSPFGIDPDALQAALQALAFASQEVHVVLRTLDLEDDDALAVAIAASQRSTLVPRRRRGDAHGARGGFNATLRRYLDASVLRDQLAVELKHQQRDATVEAAVTAERVLPVFVLSLDEATPLLVGSAQRSAVALPGLVIAAQSAQLAWAGGDDAIARNLRDPSSDIVAAAASVLFGIALPESSCQRRGVIDKSTSEWCVEASSLLSADAARRSVALRCLAASRTMVTRAASLLREVPAALLGSATLRAARPHLARDTALARSLVVNVTRRRGVVEERCGSRSGLLDAAARELNPMLRDSRRLLRVARALVVEYRAIECSGGEDGAAELPSGGGGGSLAAFAVATLGALGGAALAARGSGGGGGARAGATATSASMYGKIKLN